MQQQHEEDDDRTYELKQLKMNYFFHLIIFALILILHFIIYNKLFWVNNSYNYLYYYGSFIFIIFFLFPIIPLRYIIFHRFKTSSLKIFKNVTLVMGSIGLLLGFYLCIFIWINTAKSPDFNKDCPFNYSIEELEKIFNKYFEKNNKCSDEDCSSECKNRRCMSFYENSENNYPHQYLCNYDCSEDFKNGKNKEYLVNCRRQDQPLEDDERNYPILKTYYNFCEEEVDFYNCSRYDDPQVYSVTEKDVCPDSQYMFLIYILCGCSFIIDIIIILLPWAVEYLTYKRLITLFTTPMRISPNSVNSTNRSSEINKNDENDENNEGSFKKENTEYIIVEQQQSEQKQQAQTKIQTSLIKVSVNDIKASVMSHVDNNKNQNNNNNNNNINDLVKEDIKEEEEEIHIGVIGNPSIINFGGSRNVPKIAGDNKNNFAKKISLNTCLDKNNENRESDRKELVKKNKNEEKSFIISLSSESESKKDKTKNDEDSKEEIKSQTNKREIKKSVLVMRDVDDK